MTERIKSIAHFRSHSICPRPDLWTVVMQHRDTFSKNVRKPVKAVATVRAEARSCADKNTHLCTSNIASVHLLVVKPLQVCFQSRFGKNLCGDCKTLCRQCLSIRSTSAAKNFLHGKQSHSAFLPSRELLNLRTYAFGGASGGKESALYSWTEQKMSLRARNVPVAVARNSILFVCPYRPGSALNTLKIFVASSNFGSKNKISRCENLDCKFPASGQQATNEVNF